MSHDHLFELDCAFSPCPNDTFIFDGLIHRRIDTGPFRFKPCIEDIEELNNRAFAGTYPLTKLSFYAALLLKDTYVSLDSGAALGYGCGPMLVAAKPLASFKNALIAVPGRYTTAYLLLRLWRKECDNVVFTRFDDILPGVASGKYDAGIIIHEGRFVYPDYNCIKIVDLGEWWESETGLPIPLGCIALRRDMIQHKPSLETLLRTSVEHAIKHPRDSRAFVRQHAQELDDQVIDSHISLYVNEFTISLGKTGLQAVKALEEPVTTSGHPVIGLVIATMLEASPVIRDLSLAEQERNPFLIFGNDHIRIVISGVGKANAAMACAYLIQTCRPTCICNVGASGATDERCRLGETYHITKVIEPDRPNLETGAPEMCTPDILAGFPTAILATHDKPIHEPEERAQVAMSAQLVDMEGASVVQTCRRFHTRCFLFKFVSDTPDHRESVDVVRNMRLYRDGFSRLIIDSVLPKLDTLAGEA